MRSLLAICGVILLAFSCGKNCEIKKPKNIKTIDWENYNDVYTVFWNCEKPCTELSESENFAKVMT